MREVAIIGAGTTQFGRAQWSLMKMMCVASYDAIKDAGIKKEAIEAVYVSNMGGIHLNRQASIASALVDRLNMFPIPADTVENGPASGASAVKNGFLAIASGMYDCVMVTAGERMRAVNNLELTDFISYLQHPRAEQIYGITLPSLAGMLARLYMEKYGLKQEHLAMVAIKNHQNAMLNPNAHVKQTITMDGILHSKDASVNNPIIADPLRLYDCCPMSDGACSVILCAVDKIKDLKKKPVRILGIGQATDCQTVHERPDPTELTAVKLSAQKAFQMANLKPSDISVAELHDAFTILEIVESEEVGFFEKGTGHIALEKGETQLTGSIPINPCGGLKAKGHPVGVTGVAQIVELVYQLRGEAGKRQIQNAKYGLSTNFGGFGNNVLTTILAGDE